VTSLRDDRLGPSRPILFTLMLVVGLVLLLACATSRTCCWHEARRDGASAPFAALLARAASASPANW